MHKCTLCAKIQIREGVKKTRIFKDDKMLGKLAEKRRSRSYFFLLLGMGVCGVKMFDFGALGKTHIFLVVGPLRGGGGLN